VLLRGFPEKDFLLQQLAGVGLSLVLVWENLAIVLLDSGLKTVGWGYFLLLVGVGKLVGVFLMVIRGL
jgi:hypothetical protein